MKRLFSITCITIVLCLTNCTKKPDTPAPNPEPEFEISNLSAIVSDGYHPKWSPDGSMIVYTVRTATTVELWIYELASTNSYAIVQGMDGDLTPTWSSDSREIAFDAYESANSQRMQIWIKNLDTNALTMFTNSDYGCAVPAWSKDGTRIAFHGNNGIQIKNVSTGTLSTIPNTTGGSSPHWKFDDSQIVFTIGPEEVNDIYTINLDGSNRTRITTFSGRDDRPNWSPNGEIIAYEVFNSTNKIFLYFFESGNSYSFSDDITGGNPCWSPDGTQLAYVVPYSGIWTADINLN